MNGRPTGAAIFFLQTEGKVLIIRKKKPSGKEGQ